MSSNALSTLAFPEPDIPVMTTSSVPRDLARRSPFLRTTRLGHGFECLAFRRRAMLPMLSACLLPGKSTRKEHGPAGGGAGISQLDPPRARRHRARRAGHRGD